MYKTLRRGPNAWTGQAAPRLFCAVAWKSAGRLAAAQWNGLCL